MSMKKNIALFSDNIPQGIKMEHLNSHAKERKMHLKKFPGAKANQLTHYVIPTLKEFDYDCAIYSCCLYKTEMFSLIYKT